MISLFGNISLCITLILSIIQIILFSKRNFNQNNLKKISIYFILTFSSISFFSLMLGYIVSDFSILNIFQNSHTSKPLIYKISATWGNHEGSMLLWIIVLAIFNLFLFKLYNEKNYILISKSLETQGIIMLGFILFTIITSNPFKTITPNKIDGLGFNPILQDPALAIHPPLLYLGYVGFSSVFSLAVGVLSTNNSEKINWHNYMKPFVVAAWTFLTSGIALGSIWAYYELGWGGWWFWDPVENASLMPWLLATALLHSLIIVEKKKSLQSWVLLLSIVTFLLSVFGTFLVRSGILTSVHTFALDPERGIYILFFTAILGSYSLILYGQKSKKYFNNNYFAFLSKEGSILLNNIIMVIVCATIFLGTIYPLILEAITNNKISVGEPYFNSTVIPIIIPAIMIMGVGPLISWKKEDSFIILKKILPTIIITILGTFITLLIYRSYHLIGVLGIALSFWIITNSISILFYKDKKNSLGIFFAHLGIGLLILGITGSSVWQKENIIKMRINDETNIQNYNIIFKQIEEVKGPNYLAIKATFSIYDDKNILIAEMQPEKRFYPISKIFTTEASIDANLIRDLYIVLGDGNINDGWIVRVYYNPLVMWIWIGSTMVFLGGLMSFKKNIKKIKYK